MLFSERLQRLGVRTTPQKFGPKSVPTYKVSPHVNTFAIPEQSLTGRYHLYILTPENTPFGRLNNDDHAALAQLLHLPMVKYFTLSCPEKGAPDANFKDAAISMANVKASEDIYVCPLKEDYLSEYSDFPLYRWTQHPRVVNPVLEGRYEEILPVTSEIVPTMNCSYRCGINGIGAGCSYTEAKKLLGVWNAPNRFDDPRLHMQTWDIMKTIIDKLIGAGVYGFIFTGGGEPGLNKFTVPGIRYAREKGADIELFSNGSVLTANFIDSIIEANPQVVRISLNAGTEEGHKSHHNYLNPKASHFNTVVRNIEMFAEGKAKSGSPQSFGIAYLISNRNRNNLEQAIVSLLSIIDKFKGGIDFVTVRPEIDYFGDKRIDPEIFMDETKVAERLACEFISRGVSFRFLPRIPAEGKIEKGYDFCRAVRIFGEVGPSGEMFQCCDRNAHPHYRVGNLLESTIYDIWHSKEYQSLLDKMNNAALSICPPICKPHLLNIVFNDIEKLRAEGEMSRVVEWIKDQQEMLPKHLLHNLL